MREANLEVFTIIQEISHGEGILKCNACGCQFDYNIHSRANVEFIPTLPALIVVCPACDIKHIPEHKCEDDGGMFFGHCKHCRKQLD
jgi:hypothetical protein